MKPVLVALVASLAGAGAVHAQLNSTDSLAGGLDELGQALGEAARAGPSVFVTGKGHSPLPAPLADSYFVTVEARDASAVQAARARDAKIAQLTALARRTGVSIEQGDTSILLDMDPAAQRAAAERQRAQNSGGGVVFANNEVVPKTFDAKASLRFRAPPGGDVATFLDAVHAIGVDDISHGVRGPLTPFMSPTTEAFGFGSIEDLDDAVWSAAAAQAMTHARAQAGAIAASAGRTLGPVRSVTVVSRSITAGEATESLAVRFDLAPLPASR